MKMRRLVVLARERRHEHLEEIEESVAESVASVHVHRDSSKLVLVDVVDGYVLGVPWVDGDGELHEESQHCHRRRARCHHEPRSQDLFLSGMALHSTVKKSFAIKVYERLFKNLN